MQKVILACLVMFTISAPLVSAKKHEPRPLCLTQPTSPVGLVNCVTDYDSDLLRSATVRNAGQHPIASYRIGWMTFQQLGKTGVRLGELVRCDDEIAPGQTASVPSQSISPKIGKDASAIAFFVAEIHYTDGEVWNADIKEVNREAKIMKKKPPIYVDEYTQ
jgi:hypothetical protein